MLSDHMTNDSTQSTSFHVSKILFFCLAVGSLIFGLIAVLYFLKAPMGVEGKIVSVLVVFTSVVGFFYSLYRLVSSKVVLTVTTQGVTYDGKFVSWNDVDDIALYFPNVGYISAANPTVAKLQIKLMNNQEPILIGLQFLNVEPSVIMKTLRAYRFGEPIPSTPSRFMVVISYIETAVIIGILVYLTRLIVTYLSRSF